MVGLQRGESACGTVGGKLENFGGNNMNYIKKIKFFKKILIVLCAVCLCFSCARMDSGGWFFQKADPETALYNDARQKHREQSHGAAYTLYREHAIRYPQSERAPEVLFFLGQVCISLERYGEARQFFQQLITRHPDTALALDAGVEMTEAFYLDGDYRGAIGYAERMLRTDLLAFQVMRVYEVMGKSHLGLEDAPAAYAAFLNAYRSAGKGDIERLTRRLLTAASMIPLPDLRMALELLEGNPPAGDIMYLLGIRYMEEGDYWEAKVFLDRFVETYPRHPYASFARQIIADIPASDLFDKNVVGCLLPLSGRYESFGQQALKGIELALAVFAGSPDAAQLKILVRDSASDTGRTVSGVKELHDLRVAAIIGPMAEAEAAAAEAQDLRIPIVTLTQKVDITDIGEWVFRNFLTPVMQVRALVGHAVKDLKLSRFAILYPRENYGEMFMNLFWDEVIASGGSVVGVESYDPDQTDFSVPIRKLTGMYYEIPEALMITPENPVPIVMIQKEDQTVASEGPIIAQVFSQDSQLPERRWLDPLLDTAMAKESVRDAESVAEKEEKPAPIIDFDAVFIPDAPGKAGLIMPYLAYQDVTDIYLLGTNLWHSERLIQMAGVHSQGAIFPDGFFARSASGDVARFVARFEKTYGYTPGFIEAVSYDTAMMVFNIVSRAEVRSRSQVKKSLLEMAPYPGITGRTAFAENGDAVKDVYLLRISGGRFREVPVRR
jgi:ABC-type branched-subunit amino acid transport system substrate-binding protein/TolA-binding protein